MNIIVCTNIAATPSILGPRIFHGATCMPCLMQDNNINNEMVDSSCRALPQP